jgi:hypothetical protein
MLTLTVPFDEIAAGDVLVAQDGVPLTGDLTVEGTRRDTDGALRLEHENPFGVEWWAYPQMADLWTVSRLEAPSAPTAETTPQTTPQATGQIATPAIDETPVRPARQQRRTFGGLPLISNGEGVWQTEDGRFELRRDTAWWVCEDAHPVNTGRGTGYLCGGGQEHGSPEWAAWDLEREDWVPGLDAEPTLTEAAQAFARILPRFLPLVLEPTRANLAALAAAIPHVRSERHVSMETEVARIVRDVVRARPEVGNVVLFVTNDVYRAGVVTKVGRKNARVEYTTPSGSRAAWGGSFLGTDIPMPCFLVRAGERWVRDLAAGRPSR